MFDVISKVSRTSEKRIILDMHAVWQAYQAHEILNIGSIRSEDNIADGLTKSKKKAALPNISSTGRHTINFEQWIFREKPHKTDGSEPNFETDPEYPKALI